MIKERKFWTCLLLAVLVCPETLIAQDCKTIYRNANSLRSRQKYDNAINEYERVKNCGNQELAKDCDYWIQWINDNRPSKDKNSSGDFNLSRDHVTIPCQGGEYSVRVQGQGKWSFTINSDWCTAEKRGNTIVISCLNENESLDIRTAKIDVECGSQHKSIIVENDGARETLLSSANELTFPASGEVNDVDVIANTDWDILEVPVWINAQKSEARITFKVQPNKQNSKREADVRLVTPTNLTTIIKIYQGSAAINEKLSFSKNQLSFDANGGEEIVKVYTDAPDWKFDQFPSWIQLTRIGKDSLKIRCVPNDPIGEIREGSVNITTGNQSLGVNILQAAKPIVAVIPDFGIGGRTISFGISAGYVYPVISTSSGGTYNGSVVNYALGENGEDASYSSSGGFNIGAFADIRLYKNFYLKAGLEFTHYSYKNEFNKNVDRRILQTSQYYLGGPTENNYKEEYTINQLEIPVLASYRIATSRISHVQLNAGPVIYYGLSAKMKLSGNTDTDNLSAYKYTNLKYTNQRYNYSTYSSHYAGNGELDLYETHFEYAETYTMGNNTDIIKTYNLDSSPLNRFNFGIRLGAAFEYAGISLGFEYNLMLTNMANNKFWEGDRLTIFDQTPGVVMSGYKQRNSYWGIKLGYTFRY